MMTDSKPELLIFEHGEFEGFPLQHLQDLGRVALPLCMAQSGEGGGDLSKFSRIEVNLVDDDRIAQVHDEFMHDPTPTDVITFHHGEIIISVETAKREGVKFGHSTQQETLLYLIHGLLHLNGHDDKTPQEREAMKKVQEKILTEVWEECER